MPDFFTHKYQPAQVAEITDIAPDTLRDWRRQKLLENYGAEGVSGKWTYSQWDVSALWIGERLSGRGWNMNRLESLKRGRILGDRVLQCIQDRLDGKAFSGARFVVYVWEGYTEDLKPYGAGMKFLVSLSELEGLTFDHVEAFDVFHIAATAPKEIVDMVRAG